MANGRIRIPVLLLLIVVFVGGCDAIADLTGGGDDKNDNPLDKLVGSWSCTQYVLTSQADDSQSVDLIAGGLSISISITSEGGFTYYETEQGESPSIDTGTVSVSGDTLWITSEGDEATYGFLYTLSGNTLTLSESQEEYDFNDDGTEEPATGVLTFERVESSSGVDLGQLAGSWTATSFNITPDGDYSWQNDQIAQWGFFALELTPAGHLTVITAFAATEPEIVQGTIAIEGDSLRFDLDSPGSDWSAAFTYSDGILSLMRPYVWWDFNFDNIDERAVYHIELERTDELDLEYLANQWVSGDFVYTGLSGSCPMENLIGPMTLHTLGVDMDLSYETVTIVEGTVTAEDTGTLDLVADLLVMTSDEGGEKRVYHYTYNGSELKIDGNNETWLFGGGAAPEPARVEIFLQGVSWSIASIAGAWQALEIEYNRCSNPSQVVDVAGTESLTLAIDSGGDYDLVQTFPAEPYERETGTIAFVGGLLAFTPALASEPEYVIFGQNQQGQLVPNVLGAEYDFEPDGTEDAAWLELKLDPVTPATFAELAGTWTASAMVYSEVGNPDQSSDMIADGGSFSLVVNSVGTFSFSLTEPGAGTPEEDTGTAEIVGDVLIIRTDSDSEYTAFTYTHPDASTLILTDRNSEWDFTSDGSSEQAVVVITLGKGA